MQVRWGHTLQGSAFLSYSLQWTFFLSFFSRKGLFSVVAEREWGLLCRSVGWGPACERPGRGGLASPGVQSHHFSLLCPGAGVGSGRGRVIASCRQARLHCLLTWKLLQASVSHSSETHPLADA